MKKETVTIIKVILGAIDIASFVLYLAIGSQWTKIFFWAMLMVISLYNLFFNNPKE